MGRLLLANLFLPSSVGISYDSVGSSELASRFLPSEQAAKWLTDGPLNETLLVSDSEDSVAEMSPCTITRNNSEDKHNSDSTDTYLSDGANDPASISKIFNHKHLSSIREQVNLTEPVSRHHSPPPVSVLAPQYETPQTAARTRRRSSVYSQRRPSIDLAAWTEVQFKIRPSSSGNVCVVNAINAAKRENPDFDEHIYFGTCGVPTDALPQALRERIDKVYQDEHNSKVVYVSDTDFVGHYNHYCKHILWPTFHYQIPDNPKSKAYEDHSWHNYVSVNQAFADSLVENYKDEDCIWVNDYHLLLVPQMVREKIPEAKIGLFVHIPFPSSEVFRCLPTRKELLTGMLGANVITFQIHEFAHHFMQSCSRLMDLDVSGNVITIDNRIIIINSLPISVDPVALNRHLSSATVNHWTHVLMKRFKGKRLIVSRDKLDPIKGVRQKLLSFEKFLAKYPEFRENTIFVQVSPSSVDDGEYLPAISDICTRINSAYSNIASQHVPVMLLQLELSYSQYLALLKVADAMIVNSLREGMNLTSLEYIFAQQERHRPLILSEFVGSASLLGDFAIIINPWDYQQTADAFHKALTLSDEECDKRYEKLLRVSNAFEAGKWAQAFLNSIKESWKLQIKYLLRRTPRFSASSLRSSYQRAKKRFIFLNYEGTLASWGNQKHIVMSSLQRANDLLVELTSDPKNCVYVSSTLSPQELDQLFHRVPNLGIVSENGCYTHLPDPESSGKLKWTCNVPNCDLSWQKTVFDIFSYYAERTPGTYVSRKNISIIFHFGSAEDADTAAWAVKECCASVNGFKKLNCHVFVSTEAVICTTLDVSCREAAERAYKTSGESEFDFVFAASDDPVDDAIFEWVRELGHQGAGAPFTQTVSVGERAFSNADYTSAGVFGFLNDFQKAVSK
ncbi:alpha,alpha-trehalose-phosphate synthase [Schizosaccharomyces japonicus yFS275]|uniref:Alpha,alpha-trehalose-phosphate synthase n=1 Tax=Schizosaccharomyces japonicus (strain yFS275 / FY16936) TaxID=402676 RepID=B6JXW5_SCHJY|nr:alpha,alpha-trehalose-phosphate synthase [Schizosaccharomyces japonicus yFS275]EEB06383.1 alpha,alpha-trehalose-phosphate synthase [Schizosaccharomyces japonicus yFS275]